MKLVTDAVENVVVLVDHWLDYTGEEWPVLAVTVRLIF